MALPPLSATGLHLPAHCTPETDLLFHISHTFHTCIPTHLALASTLLGIFSIVAWLFAQLPQIYKNWSIKSTSGLSIFFLVEWCLGDVSNLLGALFTHQASWQVAIGAYYVFVDLCLVGQWIWYERLRHGAPVLRIWKRGGSRPGHGGGTDGTMEQVVIQGMPVSTNSEDNTPPRSRRTSNSRKDQNKSPQGTTRPRVIFRAPTFETGRSEEEKCSPRTPGGTTIHRVGSSSSPLPSPSPRTILLIACLVAIAQASPLNKGARKHILSSTTESGPTVLEQAGTILSWISTVLYLGSRLPQLFKNYQRKSTSGLSPHLFIAAFCGNLFYSSALLTNPSGWYDFGPYGGNGWAGPEGSDQKQWVLAALPFFLGAAGVLGLDASVGVQFLLYGEGAEKLVVVEGQSGSGSRWHWRRVSGWMRGWVPSSSGPGTSQETEREALIHRDAAAERGEGYGAL